MEARTSALSRAVDVTGLARPLTGVPKGPEICILLVPGVRPAGVVGALLDALVDSLIFCASLNFDNASVLPLLELAFELDATGTHASPATPLPGVSTFDGWPVSSLMPRNKLSTKN